MTCISLSEKYSNTLKTTHKNTHWLFYSYFNIECLLVWRDRLGRLATDPVVMSSRPATGHIRYALLDKQPK